MIARVTPLHRPGLLRRHRLPLPDEPARRAAVLALLMVGVSGVGGVLAGAAGTFLQLVVFDLDDQQLLSEAGPWGYVAALVLLALMIVPACIGIALGVRARRLGERSRGMAGIVANALVAAYLLVTAIVFLVG